MTTDVDALSTFLQTGLVTAFVCVLTFFGILGRAARHRRPARPGRLRDAAGPARRHVVLPGAGVKAYELARERVSVVNADLQENVAGLRIVQAFRRGGHDRERFAGRSDDYRAPGSAARARSRSTSRSCSCCRAWPPPGAGRRRGPGRRRHADRRRAGRVPALHRPVLRARPAALPGLRRLPAGAVSLRPHPGAAARADRTPPAAEPAAVRAAARRDRLRRRALPLRRRTPQRP